mgnify:CR=1 FL=1
MHQKHKTYFALIIVGIASLLISLWLPLDDIFKGIASTPAVFALIAALYQILRDQAAFEKELLFQQKEHIFGLGVTSHMANAVFDKHVSFCEEYMAEVDRTFETLVVEGATDKVKENACNLFKIRQKYSAWITNDISNSLDSFEGALRDVAAKAREVARAPDGSEQLAQKLQEADEVWNELLGPLFNRDVPTGKGIDVESIKAKLREILGIEKLMKIRQWIIDQAAQNIRNR